MNIIKYNLQIFMCLLFSGAAIADVKIELKVDMFYKGHTIVKLKNLLKDSGIELHKIQDSIVSMDIEIATDRDVLVNSDKPYIQIPGTEKEIIQFIPKQVLMNKIEQQLELPSLHFENSNEAKFTKFHLISAGAYIRNIILTLD